MVSSRSRLPCLIASLRRDVFKIGRLGNLFQREFSFSEKICRKGKKSCITAPVITLRLSGTADQGEKPSIVEVSEENGESLFSPLHWSLRIFASRRNKRFSRIKSA
jgi:hypothetical protein